MSDNIKYLFAKEQAVNAMILQDNEKLESQLTAERKRSKRMEDIIKRICCEYMKTHYHHVYDDCECNTCLEIKQALKEVRE